MPKNEEKDTFVYRDRQSGRTYAVHFKNAFRGSGYLMTTIDNISITNG